MKSISPAIEKYLTQVTEQIQLREARPSVHRELLSHIEDHIQTAGEFGLNEDLAIQQSLKKMGAPEETGASLNQIHRAKTDYLTLALVVALCLLSLYLLGPRGWAPLQTVWIALGIAAGLSVIFLPYRILFRLLAGLYPAAILALVAAQFSGLAVDGQPYLVIFGLKIKIVDLAAHLMVIAIPALVEFGRTSPPAKALRPLLVLGPVAYFAAIGSFFPAGLLLLGGLIGLSYSRTSTWIPLATGAAGAVILASLAGSPFLASGGLEAALLSDGHTDFALVTLFASSHAAAVVAVALYATFLTHLALKSSSINTQWMRATVIACGSLLGLETLFGITSNYALVPMVKTGVNIPFLSYGGSSMVAHLFMVGLIITCLRRKTIHYLGVERENANS